jgi:hypothetical protein
MKENNAEELKRRGFDSTNMEKKIRPKNHNKSDGSTNISGFVFLIVILLFIIMLLFIPQAIYYTKLLEDLT